MSMYCKLFTSLYQGTLRGKADEILVFTNLLAHCDADGFVDKHWRAISEEVGISEERVKAAIVVLESPDTESRSPEKEGRRLTRADEHRAWGWHVTNYTYYRSIKNSDDRREQNRLAQAKWRDKKAKEMGVITNKQDKPMQMQYAEADAKAEKREKVAKAPTPHFIPPTELEASNEAWNRGIPRLEGKHFIDHHETSGWMIKGKKMVSWKAAMGTWEKNYWKFNPTARPIDKTVAEEATNEQIERALKNQALI